MQVNANIFDNLFILEMAGNHCGSVDRGLAIIQQYSQVVRFNNIRAVMKFQLRDVEHFIHRDFRNRRDIRYVGETLDTRLGHDEYLRLAKAARSARMGVSATPFDEASVDFCLEMGCDMIKIASSDINDWPLIEKIASVNRPVVASTGGASLKDMDDMVLYFTNRRIPLALLHCVSLYPSTDGDLELNQIDFLKNRYPGIGIGFSTHEQSDWQSSMYIAYGKGARVFERHVDIDDGEREVSPYCSLPQQIDEWFRAFHRAVQMCGGSPSHKRIPGRAEIAYLDALVRGIYAARPIPRGKRLDPDDIYLCVPLQKGQLSCRELLMGEMGMKAARDIVEHAPIQLDDIDSFWATECVRRAIESRGL